MDLMCEFKGVHKWFGTLHVLRDVNLRVKRGDVLVVCGPSGSGKSTLLRCINYLEPIDDGTVEVGGTGVHAGSASAVRQRVGMVFQHFELFPQMTIVDNCTLALRHVRGLSRVDAEERVDRLLERVGIPDKRDSYPSKLSGGQRQRAAIVRALATDPELLLFDEPTSALDPEMISEVLEVMRELAGEGMTMIVVSHEMGFAREAADHVMYMEAGEVVETQPTTSFFAKPQDERTRRFLAKILHA